MRTNKKSIVNKIGLLKSNGVVNQIFMNLLGGDFREVEYSAPHEYVEKYWKAYKSAQKEVTIEGDDKKKKENASVNGKIFELIIGTLLYNEGILPFYIQAKAAFVPNIDFDLLLYAESEPVCLSIKTSLRERYKQADLEAVALKYVHRKAHCYLLTLDQNESSNVAEKISNSEVLGLDGMIYCLSEELDDLIKQLKTKKYTESKQVDVVTGQIVKKIQLKDD